MRRSARQHWRPAVDDNRAAGPLLLLTTRTCGGRRSFAMSIARSARLPVPKSRPEPGYRIALGREARRRRVGRIDGFLSDDQASLHDAPRQRTVIALRRDSCACRFLPDALLLERIHLRRLMPKHELDPVVICRRPTPLGVLAAAVPGPRGQRRRHARAGRPVAGPGLAAWGRGRARPTRRIRWRSRRALRREGQAGHLDLHQRRAEPGRYLGLQARARALGRPGRCRGFDQEHRASSRTRSGR